MNENFWKDKKVLVTGYEGFLGSHLTKRLLAYGSDVVGLDIRINRKKTILQKQEYDKIVVRNGNVANLTLVKKILEDCGIEIIFHLAAEAIVEKCFKKPLRTFASNIRGTWNILEASRGNNTIKAIVVSSSDKAYGSQQILPYKEESPLSGSHPYDVSKSCADLIAYTYYHTYGLPVAVTRCGNIFGPGDYNFSRIVPDTIRSITRNKTLIIRSDGEFTRDYVYVNDIVTGYILLAERMQTLNLFGEAFNFSYENPISVLELVKKIYAIADKKPDYKISGKAKYEIQNQYLSVEKAKKSLGWKPEYTLEEGLKETISWYKTIK